MKILPSHKFFSFLFCQVVKFKEILLSLPELQNTVKREHFQLIYEVCKIDTSNSSRGSNYDSLISLMNIAAKFLNKILANRILCYINEQFGLDFAV